MRLPGWSALMVQVPTLTKVTLVPATVHTPVVAEANVTVKVEEDVALVVLTRQAL